MKQVSVSSVPNFQPRQIVCLEHENTRLYAEVIQIVTARRMCWVRPLMLTTTSADANPSSLLPEQLRLWNLRQGADLVWPITLFRPALDTEVIPLLTQLDDLDCQQEEETAARQQLSWFVRQVWQAHQSEFTRVEF